MPCCFHVEIDGDERGCQFGEPDPDLIELDDKTWCRFHLPMQSEDGEPSPKAAWTGDEIKSFNRNLVPLFNQARDSGRTADLTGVVFPGDIDFQHSGKNPPLPDVSFAHAVFSGNAYFTRVVFSKDVNFTMAAFSRDAFFNEADFSGNADFREAAFSARTLINGATFSENADFREAAFMGYSDFGKAAFLEHANFRGAVFSVAASFIDATFARNAHFAKVAFWKGATFMGAVFSGYAVFREAAFSGAAYFREATFSGHADFREVAFSGIVNFSGAATDVRPSHSTFQSVDFSGGAFGGAVNFNNRRFTDTTIFRGRTFAKAPKFHNAVLHQDTDFTGAKFPDVKSEDAARNYRTLKLAMEQVRARQEEAMFFALEQRSLRYRADTPRTARWASWVYDWTSDYGQSFLRPVWRAAQLLAAFWLMYWIALGFFAVPSGPPMGHGDDIFVFALQQMFRPFEVWSSRYVMSPGLAALGTGGVPLLVKLAATVQSLTTFGLLTLFLLALRKRFRMI